MKKILSLCHFRYNGSGDSAIPQKYYQTALNYYINGMFKKSAAEMAGLTNNVFRYLDDEIAQGLSNPETSKIVDKILRGHYHDCDREVVKRIFVENEMWRLFPQQMYFINESIGIYCNRALTGTEWDKMCAGVGIKDENLICFIKDKFGANREELLSEESVTKEMMPSELKKKYGAEKVIAYRGHMQSYFARKDSAHNRVAKEIISSFLSGQDYVPPSPNLRNWHTSLMDIISDTMRTKVRVRPSDENLSLLIRSMNMKKEYAHALELYFGIGDNGIQKSFTEVAQAMGSTHVNIVRNALKQFRQNLNERQYKDLLYRIIGGFDIKTEAFIEDIAYEDWLREFPHHMTVLKNIMGDRKDIRPLTKEECDKLFAPTGKRIMPPWMRRYFDAYCGIGTHEHDYMQAAEAAGFSNQTKEKQLDLLRSMNLWLDYHKLNLKAEIADIYGYKLTNYVTKAEWCRRKPHQMTVLRNLVGDIEDLRPISLDAWNRVLAPTHGRQMSVRTRMIFDHYCGVGIPEHDYIQSAEAAGYGHLEKKKQLGLIHSMNAWLKKHRTSLGKLVEEEYYQTRNDTPAGKAVVNKLIEENIGLVDYIASKYGRGDKELVEEFKDVCLPAYIKSAYTHDERKGAKFSTWTCGYMELKCTEYYSRKYKKRIQAKSLEDTIYTGKDGSELTIADKVADDGVDVERTVIDADNSAILSADLRKALSGLSATELKVILLRFPQDGSEPMGQKKIETLMGISQSYISRLEKKALAKLKSSMKVEPEDMEL